MKRRTVHLIFGTTALLTGVAAGWQTTQLWQAERVNAAIAAAGNIDVDLPEAQFAQALALSRGTDSEAATRAWKGLIADEREDLRQGARYNLGNLHLREALKYGPEEIGRSLPLAELAKTSYRELLQRNPHHWDAKYNLERTLRLAPEREEVLTEAPPLPQNSERAVTTMKAFTLGLP